MSCLVITTPNLIVLAFNMAGPSIHPDRTQAAQNASTMSHADAVATECDIFHDPDSQLLLRLTYQLRKEFTSTNPDSQELELRSETIDGSKVLTDDQKRNLVRWAYKHSYLSPDSTLVQTTMTRSCRLDQQFQKLVRALGLDQDSKNEAGRLLFLGALKDYLREMTDTLLKLDFPAFRCSSGQDERSYSFSDKRKGHSKEKTSTKGQTPHKDKAPVRKNLPYKDPMWLRSFGYILKPDWNGVFEDPRIDPTDIPTKLQEYRQTGVMLDGDWRKILEIAHSHLEKTSKSSDSAAHQSSTHEGEKGIEADDNRAQALPHRTADHLPNQPNHPQVTLKRSRGADDENDPAGNDIQHPTKAAKVDADEAETAGPGEGCQQSDEMSGVEELG